MMLINDTCLALDIDDEITRILEDEEILRDFLDF